VLSLEAAGAFALVGGGRSRAAVAGAAPPLPPLFCREQREEGDDSERAWPSSGATLSLVFKLSDGPLRLGLAQEAIVAAAVDSARAAQGA
jgi:hypothetical protein